MTRRRGEARGSGRGITASKRKHEDLDTKPSEEDLGNDVKSPKKEDGTLQLDPNVVGSHVTVVSDSEPVKKAPKTENPEKDTKPIASVVDWLVSDEAFDLANPEIVHGKGEIDMAPEAQDKTPPSETAGKKDENEIQPSNLRYPASSLTPFQNLVSALILSKPLSHRLGLRTIQTLLNPPFSIRTLSDVDEAGFEGRRKIMWEARTQHKEKTAAQLGDLASGIREICGNSTDEDDLSELSGVRERIQGKSTMEAQKEIGDILKTIKGIGPGVVGIFMRRVQGDWGEVFPFADERGLKAARSFGLVGEGDGADELARAVGGESEEGRRKYVRVLDTLVGLELEKKVEEALERVGK